MGNKASNIGNIKENVKVKEEKVAPAAIPTKSTFDFLYVIGRGGFGKVTPIL